MGFGQISFQSLSSEEDYEATAAFFKGRDTSAYDQALNQSLDNIKTRAAWIEVGRPDCPALRNISSNTFLALHK